MSMGGMMTNERRLAKKMGLRPHVMWTPLIIYGMAGDDTILGINTTDRLHGLDGATNDACFEGERRAA